MTNTDKIIALAKLDGWTFAWIEKRYISGGCWDITNPQGHTKDKWHEDIYTTRGPDTNSYVFKELNALTLVKVGVPNYLTSYDAIIPLMQKQDDKVIAEVHYLLTSENKSLYLATPTEIADALLKAKGLM